MKQQSIKQNFVFQMMYQIIILVIPLIMSPLLTRRLGENAIGICTYVNSIAAYFIIFANLGIARHGQRVIANSKHDFVELRKAFWSLLLTHIVLSIIAILLYIIFIFAFVKENRWIYYINVIYVSSALFDLTWLYYGLENFKNVVIRNFFLRIILFVFILGMVKTSKDVYIYAFIEAFTSLLGNIVLWPIAIKNVPHIRVGVKECLAHLKPLAVLAISVIAVSLYTVFDKTLLGIMTTKANVAFYEYSQRIINVPKSIIVVIGTVIFPRACQLINEGKYNETKKYANISYHFIFFVGMATFWGLKAIAQNFVVLYLGSSFEICGKIIVYLALLVTIIGLSDLLRSVYIIPLKKDSTYVIFTCMCSVTNVILSIIFIKKIGIYGSVIGTICAELLLCTLYMIYLRKYIDFRIIMKTFCMYMISGIMMYIYIETINNIITMSDISMLLFDIVSGGIVYICLAALMLRLFFDEYWNLLLSKIKRKQINI